MLLLSYAYRSLLARFRANVVSMLSVCLFVAGGTLGLAYYLSLRHVVTSVPDENIIVVSKGALSEVDSKLTLDASRKITLLEGVKQVNGAPLAAREMVSNVFVSEPSSSGMAPATHIRGTDAQSIAVHGIKLIAGAAPASQTLEIMVGKRLLRRFPQLQLGYELHLPAGACKVTGIFAADGGPFEDELWTPRSALEMHVKVTTSAVLTLVADSPARVSQLIDRINSSKDYDARAATVAEFRSDSVGLATVARTVLLVLLLLTAVAIFAIATTMNAAVAIRIPELAALAAIGIRRSALGRIILAESVLLGLLGAALGAAASALAMWKLGYISIGVNPLEIEVSPVALVIGLVLGVVAGVIGGLAPVMQVRRLDILAAMR